MKGIELLESSDIKLVLDFWKHQKKPPDDKNMAVVPWDLEAKVSPENLLVVTKKEARILRKDPKRFRQLFKGNVIDEILNQFKLHLRKEALGNKKG